MSAPETPVAPEPLVKKPHALTGRKASDKQMEGLRKGMEALKARREAIQKAKEEGTFNPDDFKPKPKVVIEKPPPKPKADPFTGVVRETVFVPRKKPEPKFRQDIEDLKTTIAELKGQMATPPPPREIVKEVPVERVVEKEVIKETVVTGRAMLDAIFFKR